MAAHLSSLIGRAAQYGGMHTVQSAQNTGMLFQVGLPDRECVLFHQPLFSTEHLLKCLEQFVIGDGHILVRTGLQTVRPAVQLVPCRMDTMEFFAHGVGEGWLDRR